MSHFAFADAPPIDEKGGFAVAKQATRAPGVAGAMAAASEGLQNFVLLFEGLAVRKADAAAREHIAYVVDAGLPSADYGAREIVATIAVGWINQGGANILLHVSVIAMGNMLDHHRKARSPGVGPYMRAARKYIGQGPSQ